MHWFPRCSSQQCSCLHQSAPAEPASAHGQPGTRARSWDPRRRRQGLQKTQTVCEQGTKLTQLPQIAFQKTYILGWGITQLLITHMSKRAALQRNEYFSSSFKKKKIKTVRLLIFNLLQYARLMICTSLNYMHFIHNYSKVLFLSSISAENVILRSTSFFQAKAKSHANSKSQFLTESYLK